MNGSKTFCGNAEGGAAVLFLLCLLVGCYNPVGSDTTNDPSRLFAATAYRDQLVVAGGIDVEDAELVRSVMTPVTRWDGQTWSRLGRGFVREGSETSWRWIFGGWEISNLDVFHSMIEFDDELIVSGAFTGVDGHGADGFAAWNGESWSPMPPPPFES